LDLFSRNACHLRKPSTINTFSIKPARFNDKVNTTCQFKALKVLLQKKKKMMMMTMIMMMMLVIVVVVVVTRHKKPRGL
jgi:predicted nucleic acid-binding Zn ribbon protein